MAVHNSDGLIGTDLEDRESETPPSAPAALQARRFGAEFSYDTPRHWCPGNPALTHLSNTYTLLVPGNEGYYIRTLKRCMPMLTDPELRETVAQFLRQEGQHGASHHRYWRVLEAQGYRVSGFQRTIDWFLYRVLEPITPLKLRLSMVSCIEHVNAYVGHETLSQGMLEDADPDMRALFEWHFAEEIEHKHVAYDVLQVLAPSYALRVLGAMMALPMFYGLTSLGMLWLLWQDRELFKRRTWSGLRQLMFRGNHMVRRSVSYIRDYLRPSFHPWQLQDQNLAQEVIERYSSNSRPLLTPLGSSRTTEPLIL